MSSKSRKARLKDDGSLLQLRRKKRSRDENEFDQGLQEESQPFNLQDEEEDARGGCLNYFACMARVKSSGAKLHDLGVDILDQSRIQSIISELPPKNFNARAALLCQHKKKYNVWKLHLRAGFNILFYGLGSKKEMINNFAMHLEGGGVVTVCGYQNGMTANRILMAVAKLMVGEPTGKFNRLDDCHSTLERIRESSQLLYLIIHNVDGPRLRTQEDQDLLSALSACENIHVVASIDHINAMMMWDMRLLSQWSWSMHDATTFEPYAEEVLDMPYLIAGGRQEKRRRGAAVVLRTLTQNAREIFLLIVEHQFQICENGVSRQQLFRKCRDRFLCSNEMTLKAHLNEFKDHDLVCLKKGLNGVELYKTQLLKEEVERIQKEFA